MDGACKGDNKAACGDIVKSSGDYWISSFAKSLGSCNAYVAELWGFYEGLTHD